MKVQQSTTGSARRILVVLALALTCITPFSFWLAVPGNPTSAASPADQPGSGGSRLVVLDNVTVGIISPFLPCAGFQTSRPANASQVATCAQGRPFRELSVTAVPFGTKPGTELVPTARAGGAGAYIEALYAFRARQGSVSRGGPATAIFGQQTRGLVSLAGLELYSSGPTPALIVEWVVEAGQRLWIVRATRELADGKAVGHDPLGADPAFLDALKSLRIDSGTLDRPSTLAPTRTAAGGPVSGSTAKQLAPTPGAPGDLPYPAWWNGSDCDYSRYYSGSGGMGSYRLGATYLGMAACGPRPSADGAPDVLVNFFPGSWGEFDFECVELAMRYLYLAYNIAPYQANGNTVVDHYQSGYGGNLQRVNNGTPGNAPRAGDVISYGAAQTFGHASVVEYSNVDGNGNGTVTVIEENNSATGETSLSVLNWWVDGDAGSVIGWLTSGGIQPPPTPTATPVAGCFGERFWDVCPGDFFYDAVVNLNNRGAISGYADGSFRPYSGASRGQLAKIITLAQGWPINTSGAPHFRDVPADNPFFAYIETAYNRGAIGGYGDGTFRWGASITRGQLSKIIVLAQGWPLYNSIYPDFTDVPTTDPFYQYVETAYTHGIISGYGDGTFRPGNGATRGQISKIIYAAVIQLRR